MYQVIVAASGSKFGIGFKNNIPWKYKQDLDYFKTITEFNYVLMGRATWDSIPIKYRPLSNRINIILTNNPGISTNNVIYISSMEAAFKYYLDHSKLEKLFIIGGEIIYTEVIKLYPHLIDKLYLTEIKKEYECDRFFPIDLYLSKSHELISSEKNNDLTFKVYQFM